MKYIDAEELKRLLDAKYEEFVGKAKIEGYTTLQYQYMADGIDIAEQLIDFLQQEQDIIVINKIDWEAQEIFRKNEDFGKPLQQEQLPRNEENGIPGKDFIPVEWVDSCEKYGKWKIVKVEQPEVFDTIAFQKGVQEGRRLEREDVKSLIQSRIDEILGDAQPNPILRMELQELIKKIEA